MTTNIAFYNLVCYRCAMKIFGRTPYKKILLIFLVLIVLLVGIRVARNFFSSNFHTVVPGVVYRSGELNVVALRYYVHKYKIKTIVNLRGKDTDSSWYNEEVSYSKLHGIHHYDFGLHAYRIPTKTQLDSIVAVLQHAPKPLLVHCYSGVDRSGLVAAMSVVLLSNESVTALKDQVSWWYNVFAPKSTGYQVMMNYLSWLKYRHLSYGRYSFLTWLHSGAPLKNYSGWFITWGF